MKECVSYERLLNNQTVCCWYGGPTVFLSLSGMLISMAVELLSSKLKLRVSVLLIELLTLALQGTNKEALHIQ